jgi:hypothetical protein
MKWQKIGTTAKTLSLTQIHAQFEQKEVDLNVLPPVDAIFSAFFGWGLEGRGEGRECGKNRSLVEISFQATSSSSTRRAKQYLFAQYNQKRKTEKRETKISTDLHLATLLQASLVSPLSMWHSASCSSAARIDSLMSFDCAAHRRPSSASSRMADSDADRDANDGSYGRYLPITARRPEPPPPPPPAGWGWGG